MRLKNGTIPYVYYWDELQTLKMYHPGYSHIIRAEMKIKSYHLHNISWGVQMGFIPAEHKSLLNEITKTKIDWEKYLKSNEYKDLIRIQNGVTF